MKVGAASFKIRFMLCDRYQTQLSSGSRTQPVEERAEQQMLKMPEDPCIPQYINTSTAVISDRSNTTRPAMVTAITTTHTT